MRSAPRAGRNHRVRPPQLLPHSAHAAVVLHGLGLRTKPMARLVRVDSAHGPGLIREQLDKGFANVHARIDEVHAPSLFNDDGQQMLLSIACRLCGADADSL